MTSHTTQQLQLTTTTSLNSVCD